MSANMLATMTNRIGPLIRTYREKRGAVWTLEYVSRLLGRPSGWLSNLETGKTKNLPEAEELRKIADLLDIPMTDMMIAAGYLSESDFASPPEDEMPVRDYVAKVRKIDWDYGEGRRGVFESILQTFLDQDRKKREGK